VSPVTKAVVYTCDQCSAPIGYVHTDVGVMCLSCNQVAVQVADEFGAECVIIWQSGVEQIQELERLYAL